MLLLQGSTLKSIHQIQSVSFKEKMYSCVENISEIDFRMLEETDTYTLIFVLASVA